jgi:hypothetical protein
MRYHHNKYLRYSNMNKDDVKHEVRRIPRKYRRRHKTNKPKPTTEEKEPKTTKPINLVTFTFD